MKDLINKLEQNKILSKDEFLYLLNNITPESSNYLFTKSRNVAQKIYGKKVFIRGLIEVSNYCKNDCFYCGIRRSNKNADRYRLSFDDIISCCDLGYSLGFRTFVLQGGEDMYFSDKVLCNIISHIKSKYPDCAITLSLGERSYSSYLNLFNAGADRYLLRHETADSNHYSMLHPKNLSLEHRQKCLFALKEIGFQVGSGLMVGSPFQEIENIVQDLLFLKQLSPHMIGIGPFISHKDTPFKDKTNGSLHLTLFLIGILRLMFPNALLPATTALGTICENGRERGILAGANVIMPNLSPILNRSKYMLYDNKISTGAESAEGLKMLRDKITSIGYDICVDRGDYKKWEEY